MDDQHQRDSTLKKNAKKWKMQASDFFQNKHHCEPQFKQN